MWVVVLGSGVIAGVLSLGAAGGVDTQKGEPLPQSVPFASIRSAASGQALGVPADSRIFVTVPQEDAELSVNGEVQTGGGLVREVLITRRWSRSAQTYALTVRWHPNTYTALTRRTTVRVPPGGTAAIDLSRDSPGDSAEIRYVPTPFYVVAEMIDLAGITKDDVVFEPGCGDARLTIAAVKAGARRGVGIDLDAERIAESRSMVKAAGLDKQISIRLGDALSIADLSDASVVFLYMGDEFNRLIRPILQKQLKVGARVVSHRFTMGDWSPDKTVSLPDEGGPIEIHLWTITPAVKAALQ